MSLTRTMLRLATVKSLTNATLAHDAVFDSIIDPIDQRVEQAVKPLVVVYTDDQESTPTGLADFLQDGRLELVIEVVVAGRTTVTIEGPDGDIETVQIALPATDAGLEITLDMIEGQIIRTLTGAQTPWAVAWRSLCPRVLRRLSRRGASAEQGNRFAVRQILLSCSVLIDPDRGVSLADDGPWGRILLMMEADPELRSIGRVLRDQAEGQPISDWRRTAARLGVELATVQAIGLGPVDAVDPVLLVEGALVDETGAPE